MNKDFSNSNSMDSNSMDSKSIGKELQVRLMNLVMGEASDFELDQLQLLMEQRAELAAYYLHLVHLHGLLCEVGAGEPSMDIEETTADETWQLSPDRRERVLAVLNGKHENPAAKVALASPAITKQNFVWSRWWAAGVVATAASVLLCLMLLQSVQSTRFTAATLIGTQPLMQREAIQAATNEIISLQKSVAGNNSPNAYYSQPYAYSGESPPSARYAQPGGAPAASAFGGRVTRGDKPAGGIAELNYGSMGDSSVSGGSIAGGMGGRPNSWDDQAGIGSKAGGPDYLLQFVIPRVITENTMRRGFAPELATGE